MAAVINFAHNVFIDYESYFRIIFSSILGFLIGFDRTHKNKPAGVKTYTFVTAASALITLISIQSVGKYSTFYEHTMMDPMRLAAQIVTGLGFIGAGVILKNGLEVKGLTSAAMIFYAGGVGIGIGAGFYGIVIVSIIVTFTITKVGNWVERKEKRRRGGIPVRELDSDDSTNY
jgi:putative Mg2+ transporter-C (MgtC) family protein